MKNNNYIQEELKREAPFLAEIDDNQLYSVPAGYFDNFPNEILTKIKAGQEPAYPFSNSMPFSVPGGYFENLSKNILQKVSEKNIADNAVFEEMETISPLLNTINKKNVFSLPEDYFNNLLVKAAEAKPAKVISITRGRNKFVGYAVAAVIATILAIGIFLITGKGSNSSMAKTENNSQVKTLSDEEIVNFLKTNAPNEDISATSASVGKETEIKKSVSQMSDEEIKAFLQETGDGDEI
ncbi:MAG TPA: hypothetical protein VF623_10105 [Segetibacter sp.]|jgi:hypothetical protein